MTFLKLATYTIHVRRKIISQLTILWYARFTLYRININANQSIRRFKHLEEEIMMNTYNKAKKINIESANKMIMIVSSEKQMWIKLF